MSAGDELIAPLFAFAETSQADFQIAIDWEFAEDGTPIGYDDGAQYDSVKSTITARLTPEQVQDVLTVIRGEYGSCVATGSGYILGPTINMSAGVPVRVVSFLQDQPADSSLALIDVTAEILYGPLPAPSGGSLTPALESGVPYPSSDLECLFFGMEDGGNAAIPRRKAVSDWTRWYAGQLTTAQAAQAVNGLRSLRTSTLVWTVSESARPFGDIAETEHTVSIPRWKCIRDTNLTWSFELEIYRHG